MRVLCLFLWVCLSFALSSIPCFNLSASWLQMALVAIGQLLSGAYLEGESVAAKPCFWLTTEPVKVARRDQACSIGSPVLC